ncbi:MAG TPA: VOC family protein [Acidimicrobiia bacterium]|nr:VOC family protein [Acidimicrobiia bacterium]
MIDMTPPTQPQTDPPHLADHGGYPVYPMPAFVTVAAADVNRTSQWFRDVLGFGVMFVALGGDSPSMVHLRRAKYQDVMIVPGGGHPAPDSSHTVTFQVGEAADVDALAARVAAAAASKFDGPHDTPWNTRDFAVTDPDGNRFTFTGRGIQPTEEFDVAIGRLSGGEV